MNNVQIANINLDHMFQVLILLFHNTNEIKKYGITDANKSISKNASAIFIFLV